MNVRKHGVKCVPSQSASPSTSLSVKAGGYEKTVTNECDELERLLEKFFPMIWREKTKKQKKKRKTNKQRKREKETKITPKKKQTNTLPTRLGVGWCVGVLNPQTMTTALHVRTIADVGWPTELHVRTIEDVGCELIIWMEMIPNIEIQAQHFLFATSCQNNSTE